MKKPYFVMLYHPNKNVGYVPMTAGEQFDVAKFTTYDEAKKAAANTSLGEACGFDVFCMGEPTDH